MARRPRTYDPAQIDDALFILTNPDHVDQAHPYGWSQAEIDQAEETIARDGR
jgi:hypothetical protein